MKALRYLVIFLLFIPAAVVAREERVELKGRLVTDQQQPVSYATVVLLGADSTQKAGIVTDAEGRFLLQTAQGSYTLRADCLGFEPYIAPVTLREACDLGDVLLRTSHVEVGAVVVTQRLIRREADRFVVDVANNPASTVGKDGVELLKASPGVWINDDQISINGAQGTRVIVNERLLTETGDDLIAYLRSLSAEDIQKIEVIPISGADYDADSAGGIIKITLRKRRQSGMDGNLQYFGRDARWMHMQSPRAGVNVNVGKLNVYASGGYSHTKDSGSSLEHTDYLTSDNQLLSTTDYSERSSRWNARAGIVYDFNDRRSFGVELNGSGTSSNSLSDSHSELGRTGSMQETMNRYVQKSDHHYLSATVNYVIRFDSLGSKLKLIGDYTNRKSDDPSDYFSRTTMGGTKVDSTYRSLTASVYSIYSVRVDYEKKFSAAHTLRTGGKYTHNGMDNSMLYEYQPQGSPTWVKDRGQSEDIDFAENIGALYAIYTGRVGRLGVAAGLRAEYTHAAPQARQEQEDGMTSSYARQSYLNLFPNVNLALGLNKKQSQLLIFNFTRTIQRPSFWAISPSRMQLSEFAYLTGNPRLKPSFSNRLSLSYVWGSKYTLTLGANLERDVINQVARVDRTSGRDVIMYRWENTDAQWLYYVSLNLPFQIAKWCSLSVNMVGIRHSLRISTEDPWRTMYALSGNTELDITLPKGFYFTAGYWLQTPMERANLRLMTSMMGVDLALKKTFHKDRFTLKVGVDNLAGRKQRLMARQTDFRRYTTMWGSMGGQFPTFSLSLRYNFHSGVKFRNRSVESGATDEKGRMGQ